VGIENPVHLLFVAVVALLVLGPKRLPELARALGHGIREFRESVNQQGEHPVVPPLVQPFVPPLAREGGQDSVTLEAVVAPESDDPTQTVRSGYAPDRRPL
jgi:sec-independent protein translocase protein TatA